MHTIFAPIGRLSGFRPPRLDADVALGSRLILEAGPGRPTVTGPTPRDAAAKRAAGNTEAARQQEARRQRQAERVRQQAALEARIAHLDDSWRR